VTAALLALGWSDQRARESADLLAADLVPARVIAQHRGRYVVAHDDGECDAVLRGRLRHESIEPSELPAVGDWLAVRREDDSLAIIEAVLPRASAFVRQFAGQATGAQVLAANVDVAFIVSAIGDDLNARRLERYATRLGERSAPGDPAHKGGPRVGVGGRRSMRPNVGVRARRRRARDLGRGRRGTESPVGAPPSDPDWSAAGIIGVGKSTLVNHLLGGARRVTGELSTDGRGRHTTTHRELVRLASGALLIDTPGMRELQLWRDGTGLDAAFADLDALAAACRYRDCAHAVEPGCRVRAAVVAGELSSDRLESYLGLRREVARQLARTDALAAADAKRRLRMPHRAQYHTPNPKSR
jgi:ribosome biogenesis GTPase